MKKPEILFLYGGKPTRHIFLIEKAFKKLTEPIVSNNYKKIVFATKGREEPRLLIDGIDFKQFRVIFFRIIGDRWELVNLITSYLKKRIERGKTKIIDPLILGGNLYPSMKAHQMFVFQKAGLPVPRTIFGQLEFLAQKGKENFGFPLVFKRSGGGRGERVYLVRNEKELSQLIKELIDEEKKEKKNFLVQEFIPNQGDLRILVLGNEVLGGMKRVRTKKGEFRNNIHLGGKAFPFELNPKIKSMALKAAQVSGHSFAGVDIVLRDPGKEPFVLEVNRAPQFNGFMRATKIDVPLKIAQYLVDLKKETR